LEKLQEEEDERAEREGRDPKQIIPEDDISDAPTLYPELQWVFEAFNNLTGSRPLGAMGGVGSIPLAEFYAYCKLYYIESIEERRWLWERIKILDSTFISHYNEESKKKSQEMKNKKKR